MGILEYKLKLAAVTAELQVLEEAQKEYKNHPDIAMINRMVIEKTAEQGALIMDSIPF